MENKLRDEVCQANIALGESGLAPLTWGNVSGIDREKGYIVIKPSGYPYSQLRQQDLVIVDLDGHLVEGYLKPSSDIATHIQLYRNFPEIGGICHTHSTFACAWAQSGKDVPVLGTTHADTFYGPIPCTRDLTEEEVKEAYERNTGKVIVETFEGKDPMACPGVLVKNHGPFTWGTSASAAVEIALILENVCHMATLTYVIDPKANPAPDYLIEKHYKRKHGETAYYGQTGPLPPKK